MAGFSKDFQFYLQTDLSRYNGEWVAIKDEEIIAHSPSEEEIREKTGKEALITKVPDESKAMIL